MSAFDWKMALPYLGALATGGVPGLVTAAAAAIGQALGSPVDPSPRGIDQAMAKATPEQVVALQQVEASMKVRFRELDTEDRRIDADTEKAFLADVEGARKAHGTDKDILVLGVCVLALWGLLTAGTMWGLYELLTGGIKVADVGIVATVFTVLGSIVGYVSNIAQQVIGYYFGTSRGSAKKTDMMGEAISQARRP